MINIRILSVPRGEFNPFKHGQGFSPYESSHDVWVIQTFNKLSNKWVAVPIVEYTDVEYTEA